MKKKIIIFYHQADLDGKLSGAICYDSLKELNEVTMAPWDYHFPMTEATAKDILSRYDTIYIVDLSIKELMFEKNSKIIWIDHHKTAIERWGGMFRGYQVDGIAACRLAYNWFDPNQDKFVDAEDFIENAEEPTFVRLAGEYDTFQKKDTDYHFYLNFAVSHLDFDDILELYKELRLDFSDDDDILAAKSNKINNLLVSGEAILDYIKTIGLRSNPLYLTIRGRQFIGFNTNICSSFIFEKIVCDNYDGKCVFYRLDKERVKFSLYSEKIDVSAIAKSYGGGGHAGAAGFVIGNEEFTKLIY